MFKAARGRGLLETAADAHVNDFAGHLAAADVETIRSLLREALQETGVEVVIVVVDSIWPHVGGQSHSESHYRKKSGWV